MCPSSSDWPTARCSGPAPSSAASGSPPTVPPSPSGTRPPATRWPNCRRWARRAVEAARQALPGWRAASAADRSRILRRWADGIRDNADDIAKILTAEQGKPVDEARGEVVYSAGFLDWFAEEGRRTYGDIIPSNSQDTRILVIKQPVGVTAGITPWNLPAAMITRKAAPALAAGNTMVLKPAEQTPLTALAIGYLAEQAGLPAGVLNIITADAPDAPAIGQELTTNP